MSFDPNKDYYSILGVTSSAEMAVIKAAYKALAGIYDPDRNSSSEAVSKMQKINDAWEVLGNIDTRKAYDEAFKSNTGKDFDPGLGEANSAKDQNKNGIEYSAGLIADTIRSYYRRPYENGRFLNIMLHLGNSEEFLITLHDTAKKTGWFSDPIGESRIGLLKNNYNPGTLSKENHLSRTGTENLSYSVPMIEFIFEIDGRCEQRVTRFIEEIVTKLVGECNICSVEINNESADTEKL